MLTFDQALSRVLSAAKPPAPRRLPLAECRGLALARPVRACVDLPGFDNSSVDGYAVRAADARRGAVLRVVEEIPAGGWPRRRVGKGECSRVATGAPLPEGADAVAMQEDAVLDGKRVRFSAGVARGENARYRGEDVRRGRVVLKAGTILGPAALMLAAQTGHASVWARPRPRVAIVATGDELRRPPARLAPGEIYDGNSEGLAALAEASGARVVSRALVRDDPRATRKAFSAAFAKADVVLAVAGVSVGKRDFVRGALRSLGAKEHFWRVAIKPGRPLAAFTRKNKIVFALPGNPASAFVTFLLFVRPVLAPGARTFTGTSRLAQPAERGPRRQFLRGCLAEDGRVRSAGGQGSHMLSSLAASDCLFEIPEGKGRLPRGAEVRVIRYPF